MFGSLEALPNSNNSIRGLRGPETNGGDGRTVAMTRTLLRFVVSPLSSVFSSNWLPGSSWHLGIERKDFSKDSKAWGS